MWQLPRQRDLQSVKATASHRRPKLQVDVEDEVERASVAAQTCGVKWDVLRRSLTLTEYELRLSNNSVDHLETVCRTGTLTHNQPNRGVTGDVIRALELDVRTLRRGSHHVAED